MILINNNSEEKLYLNSNNPNNSNDNNNINPNNQTQVKLNNIPKKNMAYL